MNWNYLAGFFDGEGSVSFQWNGARLKNVVVSITQCNKNVLERIMNFVGDGAIYHNHQEGNKNWKPHWKPSWHWKISSHQSVLKFLNKIKKRTIVKTDSIEQAIARLEEYQQYQENKRSASRDKFNQIRKLRNEGHSWKRIGEVIGMKPENARGFYRYYSLAK